MPARAVKQCRSALAALLLTMGAGAPSGAQQASTNTEILPSEESCTACFAYLEFPPLFDAEAAAAKSTPPVTAEDGQAADVAVRTSATSGNRRGFQARSAHER
jgi:hypothetical protein